MASQNIKKAGQKAQTEDLLVLEVVDRRRLSPSFLRVSLGRGDIERFVALGHDQWFRLFLPVSDESLRHVPRRLTMLSYLKYLTVAKTERPVIRNYSVRAFRPDPVHGPVIDVDFALHGSAAEGTAGVASAWAETCTPGDTVAILDEGTGFTPRDDLGEVRLVADESALPALAAILASLPGDARGRALVEVPTEGDRLDLEGPRGVEVDWVVRNGSGGLPGQAALAAVLAEEPPGPGVHGWAAGESALATGVRRHWVQSGMPKDDVAFCGYWRAGRSH